MQEKISPLTEEGSPNLELTLGRPNVNDHAPWPDDGHMTHERRCELIGALSTGDTDAYAMLTEAHRSDWKKRAGRTTSSLGDVQEDIVQVSIIKGLRVIERDGWTLREDVDPVRGFVAWMNIIVTHTAIDYLRSSASRRKVFLEGSAPCVHDIDIHDGEDMEDGVIVRLQIESALNDLTPAHREVMTLHYLENLTAPDIAKRLGIPVGTVKTRLMYARRALQSNETLKELI